MSVQLVDGLHDLLGRARHAVLLRETDLGPRCVDHGDIDLIVARDSLDGFLEALDEVAATRNLHYRVRRSSRRKTGVAIYSADMEHSIRLDLWLELWQVFDGSSYLCYEDVAEATVELDGPLSGLVPDLEASIYVQHLAIKGRDSAADANRSRLEGLQRRCGDDAIVGAIGEILQANAVTADHLAIAQDLLRRLDADIEHRGSRTRRRSVLHRLARRRMERRSIPGVALVGVDGCGKTSLSEAAASAMHQRTVLAKNTYRRSWLFRGIYKADRATVGVPYEIVDEHLAILAYMVATRRVAKIADNDVILDRYLPDFLVRGRKGDLPVFGRPTSLLRQLHRPCRIVHVRVSWPILVQRKKEITQAGHAWHDETMRRYYCSLPVVDYAAFRNHGTLTDATHALLALLGGGEAAEEQ